MEAEEHFIAKIAQKAIVERNGKVLIQRDPRNTEMIWELPGGRLNKNELPEEGLKRELREELGVEVILKNIVAVSTFYFAIAGGDHLLLVYRAELQNPEQEFVLQKEEVAEIKWIDASQLHDQKMWPDMLSALEVFFKENNKQTPREIK